MKPFSGLSEQSKAAIHRRADAGALFEKGRWRGAMYLAGYALECSLKAALMRRFRCLTLDELEDELKTRGLLRPDATVFDHRIELYLRASGGMDRLRGDPNAWSSCVLANGWLPSWRYSPDLSDAEDARDFLAAVDAVISWTTANI